MYTDPFVLALRLAAIRCTEHPLPHRRLGRHFHPWGTADHAGHRVRRTLRENQILPFVEALREEFYVDEEMIRSALRHHTSFNVIYLESMDKADVSSRRTANDCVRSWPGDAWYAWNANDSTSTVSVSSPEDAVLHRLEWYRDGGGISDRQWRDVLGVLKVQGESLDLDYLRRWADQLAIGELLQRALDEAGSRSPTEHHE